MTTPPLEIIDACKSFVTPEGGTVTALDRVSIELSRAEFLTLLGPSGCGKTTLLRTISGFEALDSGDILIDGQSIRDWPAHRRPVNTVFQNYALFGHMSVGRNVGYALEISGSDKRTITTRVGDMLDLVGLSGLENRSISQLSGGQQQRVALARALAAKPRLLLLDEPLSALDRNLRQKMQHELKTLQHEIGIGFIFVTHDQEEALTMSDRIAVLAEGQIQQIGTPEELYRTPRNLFTANFLGESNLIDVAIADNVARTSDGQSFPCAAELGKGVLMLRPEALMLASSGQPTLAFGGTLKARFYTGAAYQIEVVSPVHGTLQALLTDGQPIPETGAEIVLHAPMTGLHVIAGEDGPRRS